MDKFGQSTVRLCVCCPASAYHNHNIKLQTIQLVLELCKVISNFRKNIYYAIVICFWILIYIILQISISDVRGNRQSRGFIQTIMQLPENARSLNVKCAGAVSMPRVVN